MKGKNQELKKPVNLSVAYQLQGKNGRSVSPTPLHQKPGNQTGMPDQLKAGVEQLSGYAMDDVRVHYNSGKPAQLNAHAYAQGTDIHIAPGQEQHLPHEAWHVVQQKQGRVQPTKQLKSVQVNDDSALEKEADQMGSKASQLSTYGPLTDSLNPTGLQNGSLLTSSV